MEKVLTPMAQLLKEKSTYLKINQSKIENLEKLISLLNKRKEIAETSQEKLSEFESNERAILLLKTDYELAKHHNTLLAIKKECDGYIEKATDIVVEMDEKWNEVLAKAKRDAVHKKDIEAIIKSMDDVDFNANIDVKINYYLQLKSMVLNQKKPTLKKVN